MERILTSEERIRRAEEIYNKRKMQNGVRVYTANKTVKVKPEYRLLKKMILQIIICTLIYFIFYLIKNSNYIFSEDVINKTRKFLSYDINFTEVYNKAYGFYDKNLKPIFDIEDNINTNEQTNETEQINETEQTNEIINEDVITSKQSGIGGGEEGTNLMQNEIIEVSADEEEPKVELTQMEIDANNIKSNYSFILPLKGTITSRFGPRTPTEIVSANHAGIDIAANSGTVFIAAMEGKVTCVSSEGGYGNHVYIKKDDVTTLYAHCKTIYVKEGDVISQGQQIGEVGETGNATGPHLHFEVRKEDRVVNPEYILAF